MSVKRWFLVDYILLYFTLFYLLGVIGCNPDVTFLHNIVFMIILPYPLQKPCQISPSTPTPSS